MAGMEVKSKGSQIQVIDTSSSKSKAPSKQDLVATNKFSRKMPSKPNAKDPKVSDEVSKADGEPKTGKKTFKQRAAELFTLSKPKVAPDPKAGLKAQAKELREFVSQNIGVHQKLTLSQITDLMATAPKHLDTKVFKAGSEAVKKFGTSGKQKSAVNDIRKEINAAFKALKPKDGKVVFEGQTMTKAEFRTASLKNFVQVMTADTFTKFNCEKFDKDTKNLGPFNKPFAQELRGIIAQAQSPQGAIDLFGALAKDAMRTQSSTTFLRNTSNEGTAAVRKLVFYNGGSDYQGMMARKVSALDEKAEVKKLSSLVDGKEFTQGGSMGLSKGELTAVGKLATTLMSSVESIPVPPRLNHLMGELTKELKKNPKYESEGKALEHKLFTDQLMLKSLSPVGTVIGSSAIGMATDMINIVANGVRSQYKWSLKPNQELQVVGPSILGKMESMLEKAGMDTTVSNREWQAPSQLQESVAMAGVMTGVFTPEKIPDPSLTVGKMTPSQLREAKELVKEIANNLNRLEFSDTQKQKLRQDCINQKAGQGPNSSPQEFLTLILFNQLSGPNAQEFDSLGSRIIELAGHMVMREPKPEVMSEMERLEGSEGKKGKVDKEAQKDREDRLSKVPQNVRSFYQMSEAHQQFARNMWNEIGPIMNQIYDKVYN